MTTPITNITARPTLFHGRQVTIAGVCRTRSEKPFPHFTIEDKTGTMICTSADLPGIGAHVEITGNFLADIPEHCSFPVPRLNETTRAYIIHLEPCGYVGCAFEAEISTFLAA